MRAIHIVLCLGVLALAACDGKPKAKGADDAPAGMTIRNDLKPPEPPSAKGGGKLAVLPEGGATTSAVPQPVQAQPAPVANPATAQRAPLTLRDCRAASLRGDPIAEGLECQTLRDQAEDVNLRNDCLRADREGSEFAFSRACRSILGNRY